jgi:UDP:flavonoid glycosyltransferase YjiC (YdhE family)
MTKSSTRRLACFVTPHGLGHAARAAAVLAALQQRDPDLGFDVFTTAPADFFAASGCRHLTIHHESLDIGFVQRTAMVEDIQETLLRLNAFLPFPAALVERLARTVRDAGCTALICDIVPLGVAVAQAAGIPSMLIENFTWDNLYEHYAPRYPRMQAHADLLRRWFSSADLHIQTTPICHRATAATFTTTTPVGRPAKTERELVRRELGIPRGKKMVLITMGGVSERTPLLAHMAHRDDLVFVVAWGAPRQHLVGNVICLPLVSSFYHPDLVQAADAVIGKAGYSTLAEVYQAGVPFGYLSRQNYPEMPGLVGFIEQNIPNRELHDPDLGEGVEPGFVDHLLALPRHPPVQTNGADEIADFLMKVHVRKTLW